jgi:Flp pilus assembly protein CpaB
MQIGTSTANGHAAFDDLAPLGLTPEAAAGRRARRLNVRLVAGLLLAAVAFVGFLLFVVSTAPAPRTVLVATRDLPAGVQLHRGDLAVARVQLGDAQARIVVSSDALDSIEGRELSAPLFVQQILVQPQLASTGHYGLEPGYVKVSVPVRPETAVGDQLRPGAEVSVVVTRDKGKPTSDTRVVLPRVAVDEIGRGDPALGSASTTPVAGAADPNSQASRPARAASWLVLVVPQDQAPALSQARWNGDIEVMLLPPKGAGSPRVEGQ